MHNMVYKFDCKYGCCNNFKICNIYFFPRGPAIWFGPISAHGNGNALGPAI